MTHNAAKLRPERYYNMDIVRYFLAITVIVVHFSELTGDGLWSQITLGDMTAPGGLLGGALWWPLDTYNAVGGFFALSGFLVYPGFLRHRKLGRYVRARALRILPPYFLIVVVSAVGLAALSTLPCAEYFADRSFWAYLGANLTFLNFLHPTLPGVFDGGHNVMPAVNGALWTMKIEWLLYLSVPIVAWIVSKIGERRRLWVFAAIIAISIAYRSLFTYLHGLTGNPLYDLLGKQFCGQLCYFYAGVMVYFLRERVVKQWRWLLLGVLALVAMRVVIPVSYLVVDPIWVSTLVLVVSIVGQWGRRLSRHDNVSYDMYLFHFPITQTCVALGITLLNPWVGLTIIIAITVIFSLLSWNLIGRYFLSLRRKTLR